MLWSTFLWNYQHLYLQVNLLIEAMLSMLSSSAVFERGIKMYILLCATSLQLGMITLPMQEKVIKSLSFFLSYGIFSNFVFQLSQLYFLGFFSS